MIKSVFFDLDGTLLDSEADFTAILNHMLAQKGLPATSSTTMQKVVSSGASAMICTAFEMTAEHPDFPTLREEFLSRYEQQVSKPLARLYENIETILKELEYRKIHWGIVTNKPSRFTATLLRQYSALSYCKNVICADHVKEAKPNPSGLLLACENADCSPSDSVYVGDHPRDIEAGINAGMNTIAAGWGYIPENSNITTWQADHCVQSTKELSILLNQLSTKQH